MIRRATLAPLLVLLMLTSGCLGLVDKVTDPDMHPIELPEGWADLTDRTIASPHLVAYEGCDDLEASLKRSLEQEVRVQLLQAVQEVYSYGWGWAEDDMMFDGEAAMDSGAPASGAANGGAQPRVAGEDFSTTNNQEQGVDEADFVKTDGYHIFFLNGQALTIVDVPEFGELSYASNMTIEGNPQAMLLNGDRLVVISSVSAWNLRRADLLSSAMGWDGAWGQWRTSSLTKFTVVDVSDSGEPVVERELYIEGWYSTAREVGGSVRTVTHTWLDIPGLQTWLDLPDGYWRLDYDDPLRLQLRERAAWEAIESNRGVIENLSLEDLLPQVYERLPSSIVTHTMSDADCASFSAPEDGFNRGFTSIFTLDLASENLAFEADHVVGNSPLVYASSDVLVIAEAAFGWWWFWGHDDLDEMTNIHTFDISEPDRTVYTGSGRVNGTILDQFSMSEHEGVLRVATTTGQWGRWWMEDPEPMMSHVVTLGRAADLETGQQILTELGHLGGIAEGERIWSTRFDGDMAYIVTFEQIDPLWTIDLSDPSEPRILGELEVPGVSTYIHPMSEGMLLTIGLGPANADGTGLDWSRTRIQTFNVSEPTQPTQADLLDLAPVSNPRDGGWSWAWSEATYEHKAFQYWAPKGLLAIPLSTYRYDSWTDSSGEYRWSYRYVSKLMLIDVDEESGNLSLYGTVDHSDFYNTDGHRWWDQTTIRRSIFMGDFVVAVSSGGITATNLTTLETTASLALEPEWPDYYWMYDDVVEDDEAVEEDGTTSTDAEDPATDGTDSAEGSDATSEGEATADGSSGSSSSSGGGTDGAPDDEASEGEGDSADGQ
jgi:hypothetical protein